MKKTKLAVLFTALMAVLGFSSCLSDPDPYVTNAQIMKVSNGMPPYVSFEDAYKTKLMPINQSIFGSGIDSRFSLVQYKYDSRTVDATSKQIEAEVLGFAPINEIQYAYNGNSIDNNAPMVTAVDGNQVITLFDRNTLLVSLSYYYKEAAKSEDLNAELKKHSFWLYEKTAEEGEVVDDKTLNLCLVHNVIDPDNNKERKTIGTETRHFDLMYILNGREPETIKINYKVMKQGAGDEIELVEANSPMEFKYKDFVDRYFPTGSHQ